MAHVNFYVCCNDCLGSVGMVEDARDDHMEEEYFSAGLITAL